MISRYLETVLSQEPNGIMFMLRTQFNKACSIAPIVFSLMLTACGGGGGHSSPPPVSSSSSSSSSTSSSSSSSSSVASSSSSSSSYTVGGMVSGLNSTVTLQNNSGDDLTLTANGAFTFSTALIGGATYTVTVKTEPTGPTSKEPKEPIGPTPKTPIGPTPKEPVSTAPQSCVVTNGSGTVSTANVTNVAVTCTTLLTISSTTPVDGDVNVLRTTTPVIQFSAAVNPATITNANITLTSAAGSKSITFSVSGDQITIQPVGQLLPLTQYTLTISPAVQGQAGEVLSDAVTMKFTARDGMWDSAVGPKKIELDSGSAFSPQIAFDAKGNALAVWQQTDGTRYNILANRYVMGTGWGTATLIETDNAGDATSPQIAIDANGNALAVWQQSDGTHTNIWANRYVVGTGWGTATLIETDNAGDATSPQIAIDANGNALAVWQQSDGTRTNILANRYVVGMGWGTAALIETINTGSATAPQIAINANGNALVVWQQSDGTRYNIWSNRYVVGTGWGTAALIETDNAGSAYSPQIAVDTSGNALAVWDQSDGTRNNIWSNRYVVGTGWGTATLIETDNNDAGNPQIAVDASGNALAVWEQTDGTRYNIWSNRYVMGSGWGTAALIETDNVDTAFSAQVAIDASGNAIAVWQQSDGTLFNIWSNRYVAGTGWGTASRVEIGNVGDSENPQIAVDTNGNAMAVWEETGSTSAIHDIWANRFE
jgi:Bacterial Ig-like domain